MSGKKRKAKIDSLLYEINFTLKGTQVLTGGEDF